MTTSASLLNRLEALERNSGVQEKVFFIDWSPDEAFAEAQWKAVTAWEKAHPWEQSRVIVFEEIKGKNPC